MTTPLLPYAGDLKLRLRTGGELVGKKCQVLWNDNEWYTGRIVDYSMVNGQHLIKYDDGDQKWHDLAHEKAFGQLRKPQGK